MAIKQETVDISKFKFDKDGLIPAVVQDYESGEVLMLVYMNKEAVEKTFATGYAHYYSRSKKAVSKFGEKSGNTQGVRAIFLDHDSDSLLLKVNQKGNADAEKKTFTCFPRQLKGEYNDIGGEMFGRLQRIIADVKKNPEDGAYTRQNRQEGGRRSCRACYRFQERRKGRRYQRSGGSSLSRYGAFECKRRKNFGSLRGALQT